mgnify:FL=1
MTDEMKELGEVTGRITNKRDPKIIPPAVETKVTPCKENYGQTMLDKKHNNASKPWKPKGRK